MVSTFAMHSTVQCHTPQDRRTHVSRNGAGPPESVRGVCMQGATVFDMRYLATIVANCFLAFGEILQMNTRVQELSAGVARVAQLLHTTEAAEGLQQQLTATNISGCCSSGAPPSLPLHTFIPPRNPLKKLFLTHPSHPPPGLFPAAVIQTPTQTHVTPCD